jgi:dTDP-4-amino-4,6-dideoxygalactose transaminase
MIPLFKVNKPTVEAINLVYEVLNSGYIGQGPMCEELERRLDPDRNLLLVNSGTSALILAFELAGVRPGASVITTPMTCLATSAAIVKLGGSIIWADVDPWTGLIDPKSVLNNMASDTVAICGVDWGGKKPDFNEIRKLRLHDGISIVEDAAHRFPDSSSNRGDYICYSFQAIKFLTTVDGGGLVCPDEKTKERARLLRWFGLDRTNSASMRCKQQVEEVGWKFHMNDVLAAVGIANLNQLMEEKPDFNVRLAERYTDDIRKMTNVYPSSMPEEGRMWWLCW